MPDSVKDYEPIASAPGGNPEADAYNILTHALHSDWRAMRDCVYAQDRYELEQTVMVSYAMLASVLNALPAEVGCHFMTHFAEQVMAPDSPLKNREQRDLDS